MAKNYVEVINSMTRSLTGTPEQIMTQNSLIHAISNTGFLDNDTLVITPQAVTSLTGLIDQIGDVTGTGGTIPTDGKAIHTLEQAKENIRNAITTLTGLGGTGRGGTGNAAEQIRQLNDKQTNIDGNITSLSTIKRNLDTIKTNADFFNLNGNWGDISGTFNARTGNYGALSNQDLDSTFFTTTTTPPTHSYEISSINGTQAVKEGDKYKITSEGGKVLTLSGVKINGNNLDFNDVELEPHQTSSPFSLKLAITCTIDCNISGQQVKLVHTKPLTLKFEDTTLAGLTTDTMQTAYNNLNTNPPRGTNPLKNLLRDEYSHHKSQREEEAYKTFFEAGTLKDEFTQIWNNPTLKNLLLKKLRTGVRGTLPNFATMQMEFYNYVTAEANIKPEQRSNERIYQEFLIAKYPELFKATCTENLKTQLNTKQIQLNQIFTQFKQDVENKKYSNNDHLEALKYVDSDRSNPKERRFGLFNRKKLNYSQIVTREVMGFEFEKGQNFSYVEDGKTKKSKYGISLQCDTKNRFHVELPLEIDGKQTKLDFFASSPNRLARTILETPTTPNGIPLHPKLRCRMILSVLKCLIAMCTNSKKNADSGVKYKLERELKTPTRFGGPKNYSRLACQIESDGSLKLIASNPDAIPGGRRTYLSDTYTVFDENAFLEIPDIQTIKRGIGKVASEVTSILNAQTQKVADAVDTGIVKWKTPFTKVFKRPNWWRRLWNLSSTRGKDLDHSFQVTTESNPPIEIHFDAPNKNFTLKQGEYEKSGSDIGRLLRDEKFNGYQFEIMSKMNQVYRDTLFFKSSNHTDDMYFGIPDCGSMTNTNKIYVVHGNELFWIDPRMYPNNDLSDPQVLDLRHFNAGLTPCNQEEIEAFYGDPVLSVRFIKLLKKNMSYAKKKDTRMISLEEWRSYREAA